MPTNEREESKQRYIRRLSDRVKDYSNALAIPSKRHEISIDEKNPSVSEIMAGANGPLAYVYPGEDKINFPAPNIYNYDAKLPKFYNKTIPHEILHTAGYPDAPEYAPLDDLQRQGVDHDLTKEKLSERLKRKALVILNREQNHPDLPNSQYNNTKDLVEEYPIYSKIWGTEEAPRSPDKTQLKAKNPPIPVKDMYEKIEKNVPKDKKHYWWRDEI